MTWNADPAVSYDTIDDVLLVNIVGSWAFFLVVIFARNKTYKKYTSVKNVNVFLKWYYLITAVYFIKVIRMVGSNFVYGAGQALDSVSAFDPLGALIFFRVAFCAIYLILSEDRKKKILMILFIEMVISFLLGERKELIFILFSFLIPSIYHLKINLRSFLKKVYIIVPGVFFVTFVPFYRSFTGTSMGTLEKIQASLSLMGEIKDFIIFEMLNLTNSEGVQNWTYQLVENNQITMLNGKSYFQAILNTVVLRPFQGSEIAGWQAAYHFKSVAYPNVTNQGWDFTFTAEAILNFGPNFAFLSFIGLGLIVNYLYKRRNKSDFYKVLYYSTWPTFVIYFRTDSTAMLRIFTYMIFIFALFSIVDALKNKRLKLEKNSASSLQTS